MNEPSQESTSGQSQTPIFHPRDREKRERFIRDTLSCERQWFPDEWERAQFNARQMVAAMLNSQGRLWVSGSFFDFIVDGVAWEEYIRFLGLDESSGLSWPWLGDEIGPFEGNHSETYKAWLEARGHQATTSQDPNDSGEQSRSQSETTTSPDAQSQGMETRFQAMEARLVQAEARVEQKAIDIRLLRQQDSKKGVEIRSLKDRVAQLENAQQTASAM
ncbi:hypothetical protein NW766_005785 [Fusarium irregulare]|uniref:Uncharacterized protein n=1 Tax=Fusarium irregulare TaxID=2494466 RepID=A0A9W8PR92_9HYPO|nr:hypothetical protein NW766_005785 [Fusarium irregulare]